MSIDDTKVDGTKTQIDPHAGNADWPEPIVLPDNTNGAPPPVMKKSTTVYWVFGVLVLFVLYITLIAK